MPPDSWLRGLYWFTTVFGVGVTLIDLLGLFGHLGGHGAGHDSGGHDGTHHDSAAHDSASSDHGSAGTLLSVMRYLRTAVYFSLGFGPVGLFAVAMGRSPLESAFWSVPGGFVAAALARAVFRFQQKDIDSSVRDNDLLFETATVIVSIAGGNMGKVRLRVGQMVVERYALAADPNDTFRPDDLVQIVEVTDACVYVRRPDEPSLSADGHPSREGA